MSFRVYSTPLVLGLCYFLFTMSSAALLCFIIEHLMPFDGAVENLRVFVSTVQEGVY